jgi:hypothetical protein
MHRRVPLPAKVTDCQADESLQATPAPVYGFAPAADEAALRSAAVIPPAVQALRQSRFTVLVQTRPAVIGRNTDIFGGGGQQFFGKRTNQPGIDAGEFIDLLSDTLEIIVISRSSPVGRVSLISQGCQLSVRACACCRSSVSSA